MAGPWRVKLVHKDDEIWSKLKDAGLLGPKDGVWKLSEVAKSDIDALYRFCEFMPWPVYESATAPVAGCFSFCPQCGSIGVVDFNVGGNTKGWEWNGSIETPTLHPSILRSYTVTCKGHYWLKNGLLEDCGGHAPLKPRG